MNRENKNADRDRTNAGMNYQDGPHQEGQQNNTTPVSGQPSSHNVTSGMSEMNQESEEQRRGREKQRNEQDGSGTPKQ